MNVCVMVYSYMKRVYVYYAISLETNMIPLAVVYMQ